MLGRYWWIIVIVLAVLLIGMFVGVYNKLVAYRNRYKNAFAQIEVQLQRRHDLIPIVVEDERERRLPDVGLLELTDAERGERMLVDTSDRRMRRRFASLADARRDLQTDTFRRLGADPIRISTGESWSRIRS